MSVLLTDNFNRADEDTIAAPWVAVALGVQIVSQQVKSNQHSSNENLVYDGAWSGPADQYCEWTVVALETTRDSGPACRVSGTTAGNANAYFLDLNDSDASLSLPTTTLSVALVKQVAGAFSQIGSSVTGVSLSVGDVVRVEAQGTTIRGKINGVVVISGTDASLANGSPGLYIGSGFNTVYDTFAAGDFGGVDISANVGEPMTGSSAIA